jgi:transcriptional regulator with XRE-family HTH domain
MSPTTPSLHSTANIRLLHVEIDGRRVKRLREQLGWNQETLAQKTGLKQSSISKLERGDIQGQNSATQESLARALNTTVAYLRGEVEQPDAPASPPAAPPLERRVERDEAPAAPDDEHITAIERALFAAMDPTQFEPADFDAVRRAFHRVQHLLKRDIDLVVESRTWLIAARQLRRQGHATDAEAIATQAALGKSVGAKEVAAERDAAFNAHVADVVRAGGGEPGSHAHVSKQIVENMKKAKKRTTDYDDE